MPSRKKTATVSAPPQGRKITFDDDADDGIEYPKAGPSSPLRRRLILATTGSNDSDDDDDDAPETVGASAAKTAALSVEADLSSLKKAKAKAAADRQRAVAAAKVKSFKSMKATPQSTLSSKKQLAQSRSSARRASSDDREEDDGPEDADTARLRKRMEAAMADGASDANGSEEDSDETASSSGGGEEGSDEGSDLEPDSNNDDDDDMASFHTESEDDQSEDDVEDDDDDSETLEDLPINEKERAMHAKMQAIMEAAEARAGIKPKAPLAKGKAKSATAGTSVIPSISEQASGAGLNHEEEEGYDLMPYNHAGQPLSSETLRAAAKSAEARKRSEAEKKRLQARQKAEEAKTNEKKRKRQHVKEDTVRQVASNKHIQLLEPEPGYALQGLPPIASAPSAKRVASADSSRSKFVNVAMRKSGVQPGRNILNGRRKLVAGSFGN